MEQLTKYKLNYHIFEKCNMNCSFCFRNNNNNKTLSLNEYKEMIDRIYELNLFDYINFAGGEPTLYPNIVELIRYAKNKCFKTSIITNGYMLLNSNKLLEEILQVIDCFGISIDSLDNNINHKIKRVVGGKTLTKEDLLQIYEKVREYSRVDFKINTVVSKYNLCDKSLIDFLVEYPYINVDRWKFFKVQPKEGANCEEFNISEEEYNSFTRRFEAYNKRLTNKVEERSGEMIDSYLMLDVNGNLSTDTTKTNSKSIQIVNSTIEQIKQFIEENLNYESYDKRESIKY